jgi:hypothetical protein
LKIEFRTALSKIKLLKFNKAKLLVAKNGPARTAKVSCFYRFQNALKMKLIG